MDGPVIIISRRTDRGCSPPVRAARTHGALHGPVLAALRVCLPAALVDSALRTQALQLPECFSLPVLAVVGSEDDTLLVLL